MILITKIHSFTFGDRMPSIPRALNLLCLIICLAYAHPDVSRLTVLQLHFHFMTEEYNSMRYLVMISHVKDPLAKCTPLDLPVTSDDPHAVQGLVFTKNARNLIDEGRRNLGGDGDYDTFIFWGRFNTTRGEPDTTTAVLQPQGSDPATGARPE